MRSFATAIGFAICWAALILSQDGRASSSSCYYCCAAFSQLQPPSSPVRRNNKHGCCPSSQSPRISSSARFGLRDRVRGAFRKGARVLTRDPETDTPPIGDDEKKEEPPERPFRVVYNDCGYTPMAAARTLAKLVPTLDRRTAYELVSHARMVGKVPVLVTSEQDAERQAALLRQYGLPATVEPHD